MKSCLHLRQLWLLTLPRFYFLPKLSCSLTTIYCLVAMITFVVKVTNIPMVTIRTLTQFFLWRAPQQKLRTHHSLLCNPVTKMTSFFVFPCNGAPVEWNWHGKTEVLGEKPVPVPLCPPQIPPGLTRDRIRVSAVRGRRLTAWAMSRPS
jgi:hypothetical protein